MFNKQSSEIRELEAQNAALKEEVEKYKQLSDRNFRMLESVNNSTHLSVWISYFDEEGNPTGIRFTDEMRRVLGYSLHELEDTVESLVNLIHPEDADRVNAAYQNALTNKHAKYDIDYRLLTGKGEYRMCHAAGECVRRANGTVVWSQDRSTPLMAAGTILDISEEKLNKLRFQEEMAPKIESLRDSITDIANIVRSTTQQMNDVATQQEALTEKASQISKAVDSSMEIITSIKSIADQTNLLSLNASSEAAAPEKPAGALPLLQPKCRRSPTPPRKRPTTSPRSWAI